MTLVPERRRSRRFTAWLPLRVTAVGGRIERTPLTLLTQNISKTGLCFPAPSRIEPGQLIQVEVILPGAAPDRKDARISSEGWVVRIEPGRKPGWYKLAAVFDEPRGSNKRDWHKVVEQFEKRPPSGTDS
jgi:hypothetical protein